MQDCPLSLLIVSWYTPVTFRRPQEQVLILRRLNPIGVNLNLVKSERKDLEGRSYNHTSTRECGVREEEEVIGASCDIFLQLSLHVFLPITQCSDKL